MLDEPIDKVALAIEMLQVSLELDVFIVSPTDVKIVNEAITRLRTHRDELLEANNKYLIRAREAEYARDAAIQSVSFDNSDDRKDYLTQAIRDAHPVTTKNYKTYTQAQELVSNRYTKGALVNLVNYLLVQKDQAEYEKEVFYEIAKTNKEFSSEREAKINSLFDAIKHGDDEHQQWLKQKIEEHFNEENTTSTSQESTT